MRKGKELIFCLVRRHKKRMEKGHNRKHQKSHIPNRVSISERPEIVEKRERIGDWESDSMVSRQSKSALNVLTDRKSRVTVLKKLQRKTAKNTKLAILVSLIKYPHTITYDNGSYFCNPEHSWEKGTVENTIGLIRRWIPKKTDLAKVSDREIVEIEDWLNNRPRKCLNYQTPLEVLKKERSVALAG